MNVLIVAATSVPFTLSTVQVPNLALTHTKQITVYEEAVGHIYLCNCSILNFLIYEENLIFIYISVP